MFLKVCYLCSGGKVSWKPRDHTTLRGEGIPMEVHPETWELRKHTALRGSILSRGIAAPRKGDSQLSSGAQDLRSLNPAPSLHFFSSLLLFLASSNQRVTADRKSHEGSLLEGPRSAGTNPGMAACCAQEGTARNGLWTGLIWDY